MAEQAIVALQQQVAALTANAVAAAAAAAVPRGPSLRLAPPPSYNGDAAALEGWIASMVQQFAFYAIHNDLRVRTASGFLTGSALDWLNHLEAAPASWDAMDAGLRARFQPITTEEIARSRLHVLVQGNSSINEYVSNFRRLIISIPTMDAASRLFQFARGLKPALHMQHRQAQPKTLEDAIAHAVRMGTNLPSSSSSASAAAPTGHADSSASMDLSAMMAAMDGTDDAAPSLPSPNISRGEYESLLAAIHQQRSSYSAGGTGGSTGAYVPRGLPKVNNLTENEVREYMKEGKCFKCSSKDHRSRECPSRHKEGGHRASKPGK